jgi:Rieske Fe-S protein
MISGSVMAAGLGCGGDTVSSGGGGTAGSGTGGATGGSGGTGGATGGTATGGTTTTTSLTENCGGGGSMNAGLNNDKCQSDSGVFAVGAPADYAAIGFHKVQNKSANVLLVRDDMGLYALSSYCTHSCCDMNKKQGVQDIGTITSSGGAQQIRCNCHGSRFNTDGTVAKGPASQPLRAYGLALGCDGVLYVDTTTTVPNTQRLAV